MNTSLVGTWFLVSLQTTLPDGRKILPYGPAPRGILIYTADGYMSANLMQPDRAPLRASLAQIAHPWFRWRHPIRFLSSLRQLIDAATRVQAYAGRYRCEGDEVQHEVDVALLPNWVNGTQRRRLQLTSGQLILTAEETGMTHTLVWQRNLSDA